jgi:hypothetical protein
MGEVGDDLIGPSLTQEPRCSGQVIVLNEDDRVGLGDLENCVREAFVSRLVCAFERVAFLGAEVLDVQLVP